MLYTLKWFFKNRVQRGSWLWNQLLSAQRNLGKIQRMANRPLFWILPYTRIGNLNCFDSKVYSQNGEDGILEAIFRKIGTTNKFAVEFGVGNGTERNTRFLCEKRGWRCLLMDPASGNSPEIKKEFVTAENINELFQTYAVPEAFDLLSIDVDGNDYWLWKALDTRYSPRVVIVEYNGKFPPPQSKTITYDPSFGWDGTDYYGASFSALAKLACTKGYTPVGCDREGVNAFFVRNDCVKNHFVPKEIQDCYRPPRFGKQSDQGGWPASTRHMIDV